MPKIDIENAPTRIGAGYPEPYRSRVGALLRRQLGNAAGLTQFGVNLSTLEPGCISSLRHWHEVEDEFVYMIAGEVILVEDDGEFVLRPGDAAGFKAGTANGHQLVNRSDEPATFMEIGSRFADEHAHYPEDDLAYHKRAGVVSFTRKDGSTVE
ncbi:MAG TPA: cupin domain-containing protein [Thermohalobaculum sp.]|nr:cupin domain-containing protein [Thermohalobaculum sp.]